MNKLHLKKGDTVKVIAGESKGETGKVIKVFPTKLRAIIEGENIKKVSKHTKPDAANPQGGIVKQDLPIHISNLMVVDPVSQQATRVGRKEGKDGKIERYFKVKNTKIKS